MTFFCFYQKTPESEWLPALAEHRDQVIREKQPPFVTILDVDSNFPEDMTAEEISAVRYKGPLYFDFDSSSIAEVIPKFQEFLGKLTAMSIPLNTVEMYATGGKGFHCIISSLAFMSKPNPRGVQALPQIFKEMAYDVYIDTLDLRVYSSRKGRQFRTANVVRTNGRFKVPITVDEALGMTPELYETLTSAPRYLPPPATPVFNTELALSYEKAASKIERALKNKKKAKVDESMLKKFQGNFPPTVEAIMRGENVLEGVGWQKLSLQLAIAAHALGKSEAELVGGCEGLIASHKSDGNRYDTPPKRRIELSRLYQYLDGNPCYSFSLGGLRSLLAPGTPAPDLSSDALPEPEVAGEEQPSDEGPQEFGTTLGMRISSTGIYKHSKEEGLVKCCAVGLSSPSELIEVGTGHSVGYEVGVFLDGVSKGKHLLPMDTFTSRNRFQQFTLKFGVSIQATDLQIGALADAMRIRTLKEKRQVLVTSKEGLDLIVPPGAESNEDLDLAWISHTGTLSRNGTQYRMKGLVSPEGEYKSDLLNAPVLTGSEEEAKFFETLFSVNADPVLARLFGWYTACFLRQVFMHFFHQFPVLQVYGEAGAGKSATCGLLNRMHYMMKEPRQPSASSITKFAMQGLAGGSASMPLVIDECKWREVGKIKRDMIVDAIRNSWSAGSIERGVISSDTGASRLDIRSWKWNAPMGFIGEQLENQTAVMHRSVVVSMSKASAAGRKDQFEGAVADQGDHHYLSRYGRLCVDKALALDFPAFRAEVERNRKIAEEAYGLDGDHRPIFGAAVVITGLEFGRRVLGSVFGPRFDDQMESFKEAMLSNVLVFAPRAISEVAKVLSALAHLSRNEPDESPAKLHYGLDYTILNGMLDLKIRSAYARYSRWCRNTGDERLFDNDEAFMVALDGYGAVVDRSCVDNEVLKDSPFTRVYRLSIEKMDSDEIENFYEP